MSETLDEIARALLDGAIIAMPTDTVYGLVAVAADAAAVARLYALKQRPQGQPLPLFVGSVDQAREIVAFTAPAEALARAYWPGALTIVLRRNGSYATLAAAGGETLGVRVPDDALLRQLCLRAGPLTGTSANRSGAPPARSAAEVRAAFGDSVPLVLEGSVRDAAEPSTVLDCTDARRVRIVRRGAVPQDAIAGTLAGVARVS